MRVRLPSLPVLLFLAACGTDPKETAAADRGGPAQPVTVAVVERADVPKEIRAVGTVEPVASVTIKPQVQGMLVDIRFEEGSDVKAGELLLQIDPRPFEAALLGAQADLMRDRALADDAKAAYEQLQGAYEKSAISKRTADQAAATAAAAEATVQKDTAMLETAKLELEYCSIRAPFDARTGKLSARRGTVVKANETELVELHQIVPIRVEFAVPEKNLAEIRAASEKSALTVQAQPHGGTPVEGTVTFLDNEVDRTSGTIRLMATFPNEDRSLWPGQFVQVQLRTQVEQAVVLVPARAVQTGQSGDFVFVVDVEGRAEVRAVRVQRAHGDSVVIAEGLDAGETVVTEGQLGLVAGTRVEPKEAARSIDG